MTPDQIQALLDKLFAIGGTMASKGFELAVRQVYAQIAVDMVWAVICVIVLVVGELARRAQLRWVASDPVANEYPRSRDFWSNRTAWPVISVLGYASGLAGLVFSLLSILPMAINPQWYAVRLLLSVAGLGN